MATQEQDPTFDPVVPTPPLTESEYTTKEEPDPTSDNNASTTSALKIIAALVVVGFIVWLVFIRDSESDDELNHARKMTQDEIDRLKSQQLSGQELAEMEAAQKLRASW